MKTMRALWTLGSSAVLAAATSAGAHVGQGPAASDCAVCLLRGIPASDSLGAEDIWGNPTFVGGVVNGGPTAHSEW